MAAIMENTLFLFFSVEFIMIQLHNERNTKEGTGIPGARAVGLFYDQHAAYIEKSFYKSLHLIADRS